MTQTLALLLDAYRQLNARKIFWITMILNLLCVACFAIVGITTTGISIFGWVIEIPGLNTDAAGITQGFFYKMMFSVLGVDVWLTWVAAILGLVTTASIFPEFISSGSIDVVLSKPIGRTRLFITKYVTGLLFVILQVSVFTTSCFFVIGLRGGIWAPGIFIAIPLVVLFFSYLFSICTLLGVLTRSTIAALLLTILCWFGIYIVQTAETTLLMFVVDREQEIHAYEDAVERIQEQIDAKDDPQDKERWGFLYDTLKQRKTNLQEARDSGSGLITAHEILHGVMTFLPKTGETVDLLKRRLVSMAELPAPRNSNAGEVDDEGKWESNDEQRGRALEKRLRQRNPTWILGTSALFELVMIGLGCWIFCRRDY